MTFKSICATLAAVQCLNAGQSMEKVAASAKVSPQQVRAWLRKGGFRRYTINGKKKYISA